MNTWDKHVALMNKGDKKYLLEGVKRLEILARFLHKLPRERFDYSQWVGNNWKGKPELTCGTTACAFGWATAMPYFRKLGLKMRAFKEHGGAFDPHITLGGYQRGIGENRVSAKTSPNSITFRTAQRLFRISSTDVEYLFVPENGEDTPDAQASPQVVAEHIACFAADRREQLA